MLTHLIELRRRLIHTLCWFAVLFAACFFVADKALHLLLRPLSLPQHSHLVATQLLSPLITPIKVALNLAMLLSTPLALYHTWAFIKPGLYDFEQQKIKRLMLLSMSLFMIGVVFCYVLVLPFLFLFFASNQLPGILLLPDITSVLDFITHMLLLFGLSFQLPLACLVAVEFGWVQYQVLQKIRPYAIVLAFIVGMILTPPDVVSQITLAVPLCCLYELGMFLALLKTKSARPTARRGS